MSVDVAAGSGLIPQSGSFPYAPWSDAVVNKAVTTSNPSNPRNDIVVAYMDLAVPSTAVTNAPGALKFAVVAGTAAASPSDPSNSTIQTAVGAGNPWVALARISVAASSSTVTDGVITDLRQPVSFKGRLWGGSSNTNGHLVPNAADGTVVVTGVADLVTAAMMSNGMIYRRQGGDASNWYTAGTTNYDVSAADVKIQCGTIAITADPTVVTFPVAYSNPPLVFGMQTKVSGGNAFIRASNVTASAASLSAILDTGTASTAQTASWLAIGI